jgi:hypothetical protein
MTETLQIPTIIVANRASCQSADGSIVAISVKSQWECVMLWLSHDVSQYLLGQVKACGFEPAHCEQMNLYAGFRVLSFLCYIQFRSPANNAAEVAWSAGIAGEHLTDLRVGDTEMLGSHFGEDRAEVGRDGEVAVFVELFWG